MFYSRNVFVFLSLFLVACSEPKVELHTQASIGTQIGVVLQKDHSANFIIAHSLDIPSDGSSYTICHKFNTQPSHDFSGGFLGTALKVDSLKSSVNTLKVGREENPPILSLCAFGEQLSAGNYVWYQNITGSGILQGDASKGSLKLTFISPEGIDTQKIRFDFKIGKDFKVDEVTDREYALIWQNGVTAAGIIVPNPEGRSQAEFDKALLPFFDSEENRKNFLQVHRASDPDPVFIVDANSSIRQRDKLVIVINWDLGQALTKYITQKTAEII